MAEHPIQGLMTTAMDSIKQMVDVNTVVGTPVETQDGSVIIPVSRVTFGFAAGGGDFEDQRPRRPLSGWNRRRGADRHLDHGGDQDAAAGGSDRSSPLPFAGGSGAGVSVQPVGFLVVNAGDVRLINIEGMPVLERLVDLAPVLLDQVTTLLQPLTDNGGDSSGDSGDASGRGGAAGGQQGSNGVGGGADAAGQANRARRFRLGSQGRGPNKEGD